jgi:hypothetical protein
VAVSHLCALMMTVALGLATAGAAPAAGPLPPVDVSAPAGDGSADCPIFFFQPGVAGVDVASNARGDTIVSWTRNVGGGAQMVQSSFRPAGGSFGPPQHVGLTDPCYFGGFGGSTPDVALDAQGVAVIVFPALDDSGGGVVRAATKPAGGAFGAPVDLATGVPTLDDVPRVAMNAGGMAVAVWTRRSGANTIIQSSTRQPGGAFASAINLSAAGADAKNPRVAVNDAGAAAVAWTRDDGTVDRVQSRVRPAGQSAFAAVQNLSATGSAGQDGRNADVALDPSGVATVVWSRVMTDGTLVQSRFLDAAGEIGAGIDDVSDADDDSSAPNVAVDASNTAVVVFRACPDGGGSCTVKAAARPSGGSFGAVDPISPPADQNVLPKVTIDPAGVATAVFTPFTNDVQTLLTRRPAGGTFGAVRAISSAGGSALFPSIAADDQGNVPVGWTFRASSTAWVAQVSAFDAAAPTLGAVTVPSAASTGQAVGMSAAASDRWSPVSLSWSFGDGATETGAAVTHAFSSPGAFDATVTATDGTGNASSAARSILVTPGPPPPPPLPAKRITSPVGITWALRGKQISLVRLIVRRTPKRTKAQLRCSGKKCPFKRISSKKRRKGTITLFKAVKATKALATKKRNFRGGQRLELRITAKGHIGKVVRYKLKTGKIPVGKQRCLPIGAKKPRRRC